MLNPEFQRNLWLEVTGARLMFTGMVMGALLLLLIAVNGVEGAADPVYTTFHGLFLLVTGFWGTRRAAAALPEEIAQGTWDAQRLSSLSAWSMAWGKWLGATSQAWLIGLVCLGLVLWSRVMPGATGVGFEVALVESLTYALIIVAAQASAMVVSLALLRIDPTRKAPQVTLAHVIGLFVGFSLSGWATGVELLEGHVAWWDMRFDQRSFLLMIALLAAGFGLLGVERGMREELRQPNLPWAWSLFAIVQFIVLGGLLVNSLPGGAMSADPQTIPLALSALALSIAVYMAYVALFADLPNPVDYRIMGSRWRAIRDGKGGSWSGFLAQVPLWVQSLLLLALATVDFLVRFPDKFVGVDLSDLPFEQAPEAQATQFVLAMFFFVCRDIILAHLIRAMVPAARVLTTLMVTLFLTYAILPAMFYAFGLKGLVVVLLPTEAGLYDIGFLAPLVECVLLFVWWRVSANKTKTV